MEGKLVVIVYFNKHNGENKNNTENVKAYGSKMIVIEYMNALAATNGTSSLMRKVMNHR